MSIGLGELTAGERGRVIGYQRGDRSYREKLLSMGLTPGTEFSVVRLAPLGDPGRDQRSRATRSACAKAKRSCCVLKGSSA